MERPTRCGLLRKEPAMGERVRGVMSRDVVQCLLCAVDDGVSVYLMNLIVWFQSRCSKERKPQPLVKVGTWLSHVLLELNPALADFSLCGEDPVEVLGVEVGFHVADLKHMWRSNAFEQGSKYSTNMCITTCSYA